MSLLSLILLSGIAVQAHASGNYAGSYWSDDSQPHQRKPGDTDFDSFEILLTSKLHILKRTCVDSQVTINSYTCSQDAGNGKGANWNGYYTDAKPLQATDLMASIKGLYPDQADALVANGAFKPKPRSWAEFVSAVSLQDKTIPGLYYSVIITNGDTNRARLKYDGGTCTPTQTTETRCQPTIDDQVDERRVHTYHAYVKVVGGALLPNEFEEWTAKYTPPQGDNHMGEDLDQYARGLRRGRSVQLIPPGQARDHEGPRVPEAITANGTRNRVKPTLNFDFYAEKVGSNDMKLKINDKNQVDKYGQQIAGLGDRSIHWDVKQSKPGWGNVLSVKDGWDWMGYAAGSYKEIPDTGAQVNLGQKAGTLDKHVGPRPADRALQGQHLLRRGTQQHDRVEQGRLRRGSGRPLITIPTSQGSPGTLLAFRGFPFFAPRLPPLTGAPPETTSEPP